MLVTRGSSSFGQLTAILSAAALMLAMVDAPGSEYSVLRNSNPTARRHLSPRQDQGSKSRMHMPLVAPLFIQNREFTSTMVLVNDSGISTYADLVLSRPDGQQITTYRVQFTPRSQRLVEIRDVLASAVSPETTGRVIVRQSPELTGMPIAAQLSLTYLGAGEPNYIDEETAMPSFEGSQVLRAVADNDQGSPLVAITSLSDSVQNVLVECIDEHANHFSKSVHLLANKTVVTETCSDHTIYGGDFEAVDDSPSDGLHGPTGISLTSDAMPGSFAAFGLTHHRKHGGDYFSGVTFSDPKMFPSGTSVFTGVPVGPSSLLPEGNYAPRLCLVNFSTKAVHVSVKYAHTSASSTNVQDLGTILVAAGRSKAVEFHDLPGDSGLTNSFLVSSDGTPGSVLASLAARSDSRLREIELLGKDERDPTNGGNHPWSLEQGSDSILLLFNHSTTPETFSVSISSSETNWQKPYELAPMQTQAISFRGLIHDGSKDDRGHTFPGTVLRGQVTWFTRVTGVGKGRLLQSNRELAMARSFSCGSRLALCDLTFVPSTTTFSVGSTVTFGTAQTWICDISAEPPGSCGTNGAAQTCAYGGLNSKCQYSWSSDSSVASISGPSNTPPVSLTGVAPGTSSVSASVRDTQTSCWYAVTATATVRPTVSITGALNFAFVGSDPTIPRVLQQAIGNPSGGTYSWTASPTNRISFDNASTDVVHMAGINPSPSVGDTTLTVNYTLNNQSANPPATLAATSRIFKFLIQSGAVQIIPQSNGFVANVFYNVYTNPGGQILEQGFGGISVPESVTITSATLNGVPLTPQQLSSITTHRGAGGTSGNSQIVDDLSLLNNSGGSLPSGLVINSSQDLFVGGIYVRSNTIQQRSENVVTITNLGPTS